MDVEVKQLIDLLRVTDPSPENLVQWIQRYVTATLSCVETYHKLSTQLRVMTSKYKAAQVERDQLQVELNRLQANPSSMLDEKYRAVTARNVKLTQEKAALEDENRKCKDQHGIDDVRMERLQRQLEKVLKERDQLQADKSALESTVLSNRTRIHELEAVVLSNRTTIRELESRLEQPVQTPKSECDLSRNTSLVVPSSHAFVLDRMLDSGGQSNVYVAHLQVSLGDDHYNEVVLKVFHKERDYKTECAILGRLIDGFQCDGHDLGERLLREFDQRTPGIPRYFSAFRVERRTCDTVYVIAMERMKSSLFEARQTVANLTDGFIQSCMLQLFDAVMYVHGRGVVIRDIKSDNILVSDDDRVYLTDFGYACTVRGNMQCPRSDGPGTPEFMDPVVRLLIENRRRPLTFNDWVRADIWSLGITFYFLIYNQVPNDVRGVTWETLVENSKKIMVHGINVGNGSIFDNVLKNMLQPNIALRPGLNELKNMVESLNIST